MGKNTSAISPTRAEDYPGWYQQIIKVSDLSEPSVVRGCMVIRPYGYALWENIQRILDAKFKETGHENAYFPLFIPLSFLEKEAEHVEGFAKECAVVTHHRLAKDDSGKLIPTSPLEEPLIVRPTSETIIGDSFSKWIKSYRDLPILINQWANVVRWEMRTRMFLRTTEFLWQEGHTAHETASEAQAEALRMLDVYEEFARESLAIPVIKGEKTSSERFPGAVNTYSIEAMMQDGKALQAGTSHFLGQNFARSQNIKFMNPEGTEEFAWTSSWGVSTRLIGGLIMTHSDDNGLVLPPRIAPVHVVIIPIYKGEEDRTEVLDYCNKLKQELASKSYFGTAIKVKLDDSSSNSGERNWNNIKKGIPVRIMVGARDIASSNLMVSVRSKDPKDKMILPRSELVEKIADILSSVQEELYQRALKFREDRTVTISSMDEFENYFKSENSGFAICYAKDSSSIQEKLDPYKVTPRCILPGSERGRCIFTGEEGGLKTVFARSY